MKAVHPCVVAAAILLLPDTTIAQRSGDPAYIEGRLNGLRQQRADLSARINESRDKINNFKSDWKVCGPTSKLASDSRKMAQKARRGDGADPGEGAPRATAAGADSHASQAAGGI
jgi:hypothetical protein